MRSSDDVDSDATSVDFVVETRITSPIAPQNSFLLRQTISVALVDGQLQVRADGTAAMSDSRSPTSRQQQVSLSQAASRQTRCSLPESPRGGVSHAYGDDSVPYRHTVSSGYQAGDRDYEREEKFTPSHGAHRAQPISSGNGCMPSTTADRRRSSCASSTGMEQRRKNSEEREDEHRRHFRLEECPGLVPLNVPGQPHIASDQVRQSPCTTSSSSSRESIGSKVDYDLDTVGAQSTEAGEAGSALTDVRDITMTSTGRTAYVKQELMSPRPMLAFDSYPADAGAHRLGAAYIRVNPSPHVVVPDGRYIGHPVYQYPVQPVAHVGYFQASPQVQQSAASTSATAVTTVTATPAVIEEAAAPVRSPTAASSKRSQPSKLYVCPDPACGETYNKRGHLLNHIRTHTASGQKPYACSWDGCSWRFARSDELGRHYRKHTGYKPYKCRVPDCYRAFSRSDHLLIHMKHHQNQSHSRAATDGVRMRAVAEPASSSLSSWPSGQAAQGGQLQQQQHAQLTVEPGALPSVLRLPPPAQQPFATERAAVTFRKEEEEQANTDDPPRPSQPP